MAITHKFTLMCDDVRQEVGGKAILIGVYSPDMVLQSIPAMVPTLAFYQCFESDRPGTFTIRMHIEVMETGQRVLEGMGMMNIPKPGLGFGLMKFANVPLPAFGSYSLVVQIEGEREPIIWTFNVYPQQQLGPLGGQAPFRMPQR
jgi:hypothetical protein